MRKILSISAAKTTTLEPPVKTKPAVDIEVLASIESATLEDSFVYVHCYYNNPADEMLIRIWKTTFLIDKATGAKSPLLHVENISMAPMWTMIPKHATYNFLLIFGALSKGCQTFDLVEEIPQPGGFEVRNIKRNQQDVYHINI